MAPDAVGSGIASVRQMPAWRMQFSALRASYIMLSMAGKAHTGWPLRCLRLSKVSIIVNYHELLSIFVTCSAILGLLDKDDDLRRSHEFLNTEKNCVFISNRCSDMTS